MKVSRRDMLAGVASAASAAALSRPSIASPVGDEAYWQEISNLWDVDPAIHNLEHGYFGLMARPVRERFAHYTDLVNRQGAAFARQSFGEEAREVHRVLATSLGVGRDEVVFTRNATEALVTLIMGYGNLGPKDRVLIADLDYGAMRDAMRSKAARSGAKLTDLSIPEPATYEGLIAFYRDAIDEHPDTKLLLLTEMSHRTGLVMPAKEIVALVQERGIDVILDSAHAYGQIESSPAETGAPFIGVNLHKWIGAPVGVGAMVIRQDRLGAIAPHPASGSHEQDLISGRVHTGTSNFAALLAAKEALRIHHEIGPERKAKRLRQLRRMWTEPLRELGHVDILTPEDPCLYAGITSLRLDGLTSNDDYRTLADHLWKDHKIVTVQRTGLASGPCLRITPAIFTLPKTLDVFVQAMRSV